jgi:hypothetical protein
MGAHSDPQTRDRSEVMSRAERRLLAGITTLVLTLLLIEIVGNTLWDWIERIVVPFALPVTVTLVLHHTRSSERS